MVAVFDGPIALDSCCQRAFPAMIPPVEHLRVCRYHGMISLRLKALPIQRTAQWNNAMRPGTFGIDGMMMLQ